MSECSSTFDVHRRAAPDKRIDIYPTCIPELKDATKFETDHLKIVYKTEDEAISINDEKLKVRAASAFYHLQIAREYFIENFGEKSISHMKQLVVRIEMDRGFTDVAHFISEKQGLSHNNALTIPPSDHNRLPHYDEWGYEIWFRPGKKIKSEIGTDEAAAMLESQQMRESLAMNMFTTPAMDLMSELGSTGRISSMSMENHLETLGVSLGLLYILPKAIKLSGKVIKQTTFLDSVLIPEVIYHEFVHVALGNYLSPRVSTPVIEGLANFYAAKIAGGDKIAHRSGDRQRGLRSRDGSKESWYQLQLERGALAQHNFTFRLLTQISDVLGEDAGVEVIYNSVQRLDEGSDIKYDLMNAIFLSLEESKKISNPRLKKMRLNRLANEFGL